MNKKERLFRFKQFAVSHDKSAMKVGVDGVLLGAWADIEDATVILDAGCGCGLIALMAAQRNPHAVVHGIDIHQPSVDEATANALSSPWSDRIDFALCNFVDYRCDKPINHILSNPPFFDSGITDPQTDREFTRHSAMLGPLSLISVGSRLLAPDGRISMIAPPEWLDRICVEARNYGMYINRLMYVYSRPARPPKRILVELRRGEIVKENIKFEPTSNNSLYIETLNSDGVIDYSPEYRLLSSPFYLKF
jgi:tRNA1Val (adenine37-N6)-methyltransferase